MALKSIARLEKQLELEASLLVELNEQTRIAIGINNAPVEPTLDFSRLTDEEGEQYKALARKCGADSLNSFKRVSRL
jgi:hypothetical protein